MIGDRLATTKSKSELVSDVWRAWSQNDAKEPDADVLTEAPDACAIVGGSQTVCVRLWTGLPGELLVGSVVKKLLIPGWVLPNGVMFPNGGAAAVWRTSISLWS